MAEAFWKKIIVAGAIAGLIFPACTSVHKTVIKQTAADSGRLLAEGNFQKALDLYQAAIKKYPLASLKPRRPSPRCCCTSGGSFSRRM